MYRLLAVMLVASTGCMSVIGYTSSGALARAHNAERERAIARGDTDIPPPDDVHASKLTGLAVGAALDVILVGAAVLVPHYCVRSAGQSPQEAGC